MRGEWLGMVWLGTCVGALLVGGALWVVGFEEQPEPVDPASVQPAKISVEEARFMLECTQDWGLTGDECRAVLHGENPPVYDGETGC